MLTKEQIKQVEHSYKNGDDIVIQIGDKVYVAQECFKHRKEATVEFQGCQEVDESCFEPNGEYYGDVLPNEKNFILEDHLADNNNLVETVYYDDEIKEVW